MFPYGLDFCKGQPLVVTLFLSRLAPFPLLIPLLPLAVVPNFFSARLFFRVPLLPRFSFSFLAFRDSFWSFFPLERGLFP